MKNNKIYTISYFKVFTYLILRYVMAYLAVLLFCCSDWQAHNILFILYFCLVYIFFEMVFNVYDIFVEEPYLNKYLINMCEGDVWRSIYINGESSRVINSTIIGISPNSMCECWNCNYQHESLSWKYKELIVFDRSEVFGKNDDDLILTNSSRHDSVIKLIEHAEKYVGEVSIAWAEKSLPAGLRVLCCEYAPKFGYFFNFMTVGLSQHELSISDQKTVQQELFISYSFLNGMVGMNVADSDAESLALLLFYISDLVIKNNNPVLYGQLIKLPEDMVRRFGFDDLYCTSPDFIDDDFTNFETALSSTMIVRLVPIYKSEADYVAANGWSGFLDLVHEKRVNLSHWYRHPII